jgi:hypothetical protein
MSKTRRHAYTPTASITPNALSMDSPAVEI